MDRKTSTVIFERWKALPDDVKWAIWTLKIHGLHGDDYISLSRYATRDMDRLYTGEVKKLTKSEESRYEILAKQLQEYWPSGMKEGKWRWRGDKADVSLRLKRLLERKCFENVTDDDVLRCARIYVAQYDEDNKYMCLLPYFILKTKTVAGKNVYTSKLGDMLLSRNESEQFEIPVHPQQDVDYGEQLG